MHPELDALKATIDAGDPKDSAANALNAQKMQTLFQKYKRNPLKAIVAPLAQAPVFISMFFALQKVPDVYPNQLADSGALWFMDLTEPSVRKALGIWETPKAVPGAKKPKGLVDMVKDGMKERTDKAGWKEFEEKIRM